MRRRFFLTDNPGAGYGSRRLVDAVTITLQRAGAEVVRGIAVDVDAAHATMAKAASSGEFDAILAAGGDGTVRLAAKAAFGTDTPVGVIPLGTGNVLAHEAGLPRAPGAIAKLLLYGEARLIDAARANGELFLLMAGIGFDGRIVAGLDQGLKKQLGKLAYVPPTLRALAHGADKLEVMLDGSSYAATWAVICNARHYGGRFVMAGNAEIERPGLEAILFAGEARWERIAQLWALARGSLSRDQLAMQLDGTDGDVLMRACRRVIITSPVPVPTQLDGDPFLPTPLVIEDVGLSVRLILPPRSR